MLSFPSYSDRPSTHQLALESADPNFIRSLSPIRVIPEKRTEHIHTSLFGAHRSPRIPTGSDNAWCNKGLVIAGERCTPALQRLSSPDNFTKSYKTKRSFPNSVEICDFDSFPRYSPPFLLTPLFRISLTHTFIIIHLPLVVLVIILPFPCCNRNKGILSETQSF